MKLLTSVSTVLGSMEPACPVPRPDPLGARRGRYFICDKKLAALGWKEATSWEDGLRKTIDWYLANGFGDYWENGDIENALRPHPGAAH